MFYVAVGHEVDGSFDEGKLLAASPRSMKLLGAFAEIEATLAGKDGLGTPSMMTGAPSEQDALEGYSLYSRSQTARITFEGGAYKLQMSAYDYTAKDYTVKGLHGQRSRAFWEASDSRKSQGALCSRRAPGGN